MPALHLTQKMKEALERLYETDGQSDWVNMYTAAALANRGLVTVSAMAQRTTGGRFPEHKATLNANGRKWCERHFAILRGRRE